MEVALGQFDAMAAAVDAIYAAALGQSAWRVALDHVLDVTGFTAASAYAQDHFVKAVATDEYVLPREGLWHRHDPAAQRDYMAEYYRHEPGRHYRLRHPNERVYYESLYADDRELDRNPLYAWAEREHDVRYFAYGQTDPGQPVGAIIALHRPRRRGHIQPDELARFRCLLEHFDRAVWLEHRIGKALAEGVAPFDFMEANPTGIVILDALGRVIGANRTARAVAQRCDGMVLRADGISALRPRDDARLQRLIAAAAAATAGEGLASGGSMALPRRNGGRGYLVTVSPLPRRESVIFDLLPAVCVLITDPESVLASGAELLRQAYGITPAELRLVERLLAGETPAEAAATLGVSLPTVRSQLASLYRKTETRRQPELVRLLVSLPWWVR